MNKIQKVSVYVLTVLNALIIILPLSMLLSWIVIDVKDSGTITSFIAYGFQKNVIHTPEGYVNLELIHWTAFTKVLACLSRLVEIGPVFVSLFYLKKIFASYRNGEIFNTANAKNYNRLGWLFFIDALLTKPLSHGLMILAVTLSNPAGHRYITLTLGTTNMEVLFCGVLVLVISWVMLEGSKIQDEYKLTV